MGECLPVGTSRLEKLLESIQKGDDASEELQIPQGLRNRLYVLFLRFLIQVSAPT